MSDIQTRQELEQFANTAGQPHQPTPHGHALVQPTRSLTPLGAQPVARLREEPVVLRKLAELGAMAADDWFYRFPVRTAAGGQDWIEGPSIKLANNVARLYGNCVTEVRELDTGDAFVFYARFTDLETGFSMERAYRQRKSQQTIKSKDRDRQIDQIYQVGQSKAIRNVIVNALQFFCDYAFEQAQGSLVQKIGKDLEGWRQRTLEALARIPVEAHRVERVIGRSAKDWLAPDIARIVAMGKAVSDGLATVDETFPADTTVVEPSKPEQSKPVGETTAPASDAAAQPAGEEATAPASTPSEPEKPAGPSSSGAAPTEPKTVGEYMALVDATCNAATDGDQLNAWFVSDQQRRLRNRANMTSEDTAAARNIVTERAKQLKASK